MWRILEVIFRCRPSKHQTFNQRHKLRHRDDASHLCHTTTAAAAVRSVTIWRIGIIFNIQFETVIWFIHGIVYGIHEIAHLDKISLHRQIRRESHLATMDVEWLMSCKTILQLLPDVNFVCQHGVHTDCTHTWHNRILFSFRKCHRPGHNANTLIRWATRQMQFWVDSHILQASDVRCACVCFVLMNIL